MIAKRPITRGAALDYNYLTYDALGNPDGSYDLTDSVGTFRYNTATHYGQDAIGRTTQTCVDITNITGTPPQHCSYTTFNISGQDSVSTEYAPALNTAPAQSTVVRKYFGNEGDVLGLSREKTGGAGQVWSYFWYDRAGRVTIEAEATTQGDRNAVLANASYNKSYRKYDQAGNLDTIINRRGQVITMSYDGANRLLQRVVPQVTITAASPTNSFAGEIGTYPWNLGNRGDYIMAADTYNFAYDAAGNMISATNNNSHVYRSYTPNGLLKTDTLDLAKAGGGFAHYPLSNRYDALNRRTALQMPVALAGGDSTLHFAYTAVSSELNSVTDPLNNPYYFSFNLKGEQTSLGQPGGVAQTLDYDGAGNLARDSIYQATAGVIRKTAFTYDNRYKRLTMKDPTAFAETTVVSYTGLGHLLSSHVSQRASNGMGGTGYGATIESLSPDALGNALGKTTLDTVSKTVHGGSFSSNATSHDSITLDVIWRVQSALGTAAGVATSTTYEYDEDGNVLFYRKQPTSSSSTAYREDRYSFYDAEGRLRAADFRFVTGAAGSVPDIVQEDYRYDALGRRYAVRADKFCGDVPQFLCGLSTLRRTLWDGDRELMEIQVPAKIREWYTSADTLLNNDQYLPRLPMLNTIDYNPYSGRVLYVPGLALDQPVGLVRYNYVNRLPDNGTVPESLLVLPTAAMSIHRDAKGRAASVWCASGAQRCTGNREVTGTSARQIVTLPEQTFFLDRPKVVSYAWQGTLLLDKANDTRTNFRRNRYYDPASGRFTQEDPIGLGGGLNLYGFADGDPVNFSDPFGLDACTKGDLDNGKETMSNKGGPVCVERRNYEAQDKLLDCADKQLNPFRATSEVTAIPLEKRMLGAARA